MAGDDGGSNDHDRIRRVEGIVDAWMHGIDQRWDAHTTVHAMEQQALALAAGQWPTRQELAQELDSVKSSVLQAGMPRVEYQAAHLALMDRVSKLELGLLLVVGREAFDLEMRRRDEQHKVEAERRDQRLGALEDFKNRAIGGGLILTVFAGLIGAAVVKAFG